MRSRFLCCLFAIVSLSWLGEPAKARAQGTTPPAIRDSNVGYIDPAIPGNVVRFRYDAGFDNRRPTRAEFFWASNSGTTAERAVDYQDVGTYLEYGLSPRLSAFVDLPVRFLDPEIRSNAAGLADMNFGFKYAFVATDDLVATFQLRTYVPTGDGDQGLGVDHVSIEPALLLYKPVGERCGIEAELRDWIPVAGSDFSGNIIRYGVGVHYDLAGSCNWRLAPVAEFVGWTVLGGKTAARQSDGAVEVHDAAGESIVNAKLGLRLKVGDRWDLYTGYGRPLTGDRWYEHTFRLELRWFF